MPRSKKITSAVLVRKLETIFTLTDDERQVLETLPTQIVALKENQDIVRMGDRPSRSCLILSGIACTYKGTGDGKRQIHNFHMPGDIPDLQSLHLEVLDKFGETLLVARLDACRNTLMNEREDHRSIADIAYSFGFNDLSGFYRRYRTQFGQTPRETRLSARCTY